MKVRNWMAKLAYKVLTKWVIQDGAGSFPFMDDVVDKDDVAREILDNHYLLRKIPEHFLVAMDKVVHASAVGLMIALKGEKDRDAFLYASGEVSGMKKAINGIHRIANMDTGPFEKRLARRKER